MLFEIYPWTSGITILALLMLFWATARVGAARGKYGVKAPAITGVAEFERLHRAHANSVEQAVVFLPAVWLFAMAWGDLYAGIAGLGWVIGRWLYILGYSKDAEKRAPGMLITAIISIAMIIAAAVKWVMLAL